jgi:hypothetical protein
VLVDLFYTATGEEKVERGETKERKRKKRDEKERGKMKEVMKVPPSIAI